MACTDSRVIVWRTGGRWRRLLGGLQETVLFVMSDLFRALGVAGPVPASSPSGAVFRGRARRLRKPLRAAVVRERERGRRQAGATRRRPNRRRFAVTDGRGAPGRRSGGCSGWRPSQTARIRGGRGNGPRPPGRTERGSGCRCGTEAPEVERPPGAGLRPDCDRPARQPFPSQAIGQSGAGPGPSPRAPRNQRVAPCLRDP